MKALLTMQTVSEKKSSDRAARSRSNQRMVPPGSTGFVQNIDSSSGRDSNGTSPGADQILASLSLQSVDGRELHTACLSPSASVSGEERIGQLGSLQLSLTPSQTSGAPG